MGQDKPNDRPQAQTAGQLDVDPKLFAVVNGEKFPRPALETMFVDSGGVSTEQVGGCSCNPVVYCSCNKVAKVEPACSCVGHVSCSCDSHSSGGGVTYGCQCAPVH